RIQTIAELSSSLLELPINIDLLGLFQRRQPRAHAYRISAKGPRLIDRSDGRDQLHQVSAPTVGGNRKTSADNFSKSDQIGPNAENLGHPADPDAKTGDDLIKDH